MKEKEIIRRLQVQDAQEVENIISKHYPLVYSYLFRRSRNAEMAKELTQETFFRFLKNIHSYESKGKLINYLYRIALHLFYDEMRRNKYYSMYDIDFNQVEDEQESVQNKMNREQDIKDVRYVLSLLPSTYQDILIFRFYERLKFRDIAKITGIPPSTLKSRYRVALQLVEKYLREGE